MNILIKLTSIVALIIAPHISEKESNDHTMLDTPKSIEQTTTFEQESVQKNTIVLFDEEK